MKRSLIFMFVVGLNSLCILSCAQENKHLQIGDTIPNVSLDHIINYPTTKAKLYDFKSKLLILDFWDVWCAPCIAHMPQIEALQKAFPDDIRILLVTKSTEKQVRELINRNKIVRDCKLPMLVADSTLSLFFAYQTVPAYAWIDKNGVLQHFTAANSYLTAAFIRKFLDGKKLVMPVKDEYGNFKGGESLLTEGNGRNLSKLSYYSLISHRVNFDNQFTAPLFDPSTGAHIGIHCINQSRINLFLTAYADSLSSGGFRAQENRVIVQVADSVNYQPFERHSLDDHWRLRNLFCYEARLPPARMHLLNTVMQRDLLVYFGVNVRIEHRMMPCLVLKALNPADPANKIRSKGGKPFRLLPHGIDSLAFSNTDFGSLLLGIDMLFQSVDGRSQILVNESGVNRTTLIDIRMGGNLKNLEEFRKRLRVFGFDLVPERKNIPMLILSE